jgi:hypothetical protein
MYIGKIPTVGNFQICDAITVVDAQAAYTMQVSSVDVFPETANHMLVSLNGILQAPTSSFTVSGSTITFASALETGDVIDFIQILGNVLDLGVPSDNTVSLAKLTATGTKDATTFLRGDNTFGVPPLGGITMADQWRLTTDTNDNINADVTTNWERNDASSWSGIGTGLTESSGVFTLPQTGIYKIDYQGVFQVVSGDSNCEFLLKTTTDNSTYTVVTHTRGGAGNTGTSDESSGSFLFDVTNTTTHKFKFATNSFSNGTLLQGSTNLQMSGFSIIRLGDT